MILTLVMLITIGSISIYLLYPIRATNVPRMGENRAAIVGALSIQRPNPAFESEAVSYLTSAGLSVDVYHIRARKLLNLFMEMNCAENSFSRLLTLPRTLVVCEP